MEEWVSDKICNNFGLELSCIDMFVVSEWIFVVDELFLFEEFRGLNSIWSCMSIVGGE